MKVEKIEIKHGEKFSNGKVKMVVLNSDHIKQAIRMYLGVDNNTNIRFYPSATDEVMCRVDMINEII